MSLFPDMTDDATYDALYDDDTPLRPTIEALRASCDSARGPMERLERGSVFLYTIGADRVLKVYPPPDEEEARVEEAVQRAVFKAELGLDVPKVLAAGGERGWRWMLMERLDGTPARDVWDTLEPAELADIAGKLGAWMRAFHDDARVQSVRLTDAREGWDAARAELRSGIVEKHRKRGASEEWLEQIEPYLRGWEPTGETRLIHADLHPGNLMLGRGESGAWSLTGVLDFADTLRAPIAYDLGAPLSSVTAGDADAASALLSGVYGGAPSPDTATLWRWLLLHRFSNLARYVRAWGGGDDPGQTKSLADLGEALIRRG